MSQVLVLQRSEHFPVGRIRTVLADFGIPINILELHCGAAVPGDGDGVRALVLLGGPQRISDGTMPWLESELALVKQFVEADRPVLAVGSGAQILAQAAGAKVYPLTAPGPDKNTPGPVAPVFGFRPITLPFPGGTDPLMRGPVNGTPMLHLAADTFDLPAFPKPDNPPPGPPPPTGNQLLCNLAGVRNAGFTFKKKLVAFAFELAMDEPAIGRLLSANPLQLDAGTLSTLRDALPGAYPRFDGACRKILENWVQYLKAY